MSDRLTPLDRRLSITDGSGIPTAQFQVWWLQLINAVMSPTYGFPLKSCTVATLPATGAAGRLIFVSDEVGGSVPAFDDGAGNWLRVTDRAIVS